jgi:hypothetical protein
MVVSADIFIFCAFLTKEKFENRFRIFLPQFLVLFLQRGGLFPELFGLRLRNDFLIQLLVSRCSLLNGNLACGTCRLYLAQDLIDLRVDVVHRQLR